MFINDSQYGRPAQAYVDTKANIEALDLDTSDEGRCAYATDTDRWGVFDGSAWNWYNVLDLTDSPPSPAQAYVDTKANIESLSLGAGDEGCYAYATDTDEWGTFDGSSWNWIEDFDLTSAPPVIYKGSISTIEALSVNEGAIAVATEEEFGFYDGEEWRWFESKPEKTVMLPIVSVYNATDGNFEDLQLSADSNGYVMPDGKDCYAQAHKWVVPDDLDPDDASLSYDCYIKVPNGIGSSKYSYVGSHWERWEVGDSSSSTGQRLALQAFAREDCWEIAATGSISSVNAGDIISIRYRRRGDDSNDTIEADVWAGPVIITYQAKPGS